jgi:hypothetical protein
MKTLLVWVLLIYSPDVNHLPVASVPGIVSRDECIVLAAQMRLEPKQFLCFTYEVPKP